MHLSVACAAFLVAAPFVFYAFSAARQTQRQTHLLSILGCCDFEPEPDPALFAFGVIAVSSSTPASRSRPTKVRNENTARTLRWSFFLDGERMAHIIHRRAVQGEDG